MADGTLKVGTITTSSGSGTITIPNTVTVAGAMANTPAFKAVQSTDQTLAHNTFTIINLQTEEWDTDSAFDNSTNYRFTVPAGKAGKYFFLGTLRLSSMAASDKIQLRIYKNGNSENTGTLFYFLPIAENAVIQVHFADDASVGDYYDLRGYHFSGNSASKSTLANYCSFQGYKLIGV